MKRFFAFSLLLFTFAVWAEELQPVPYLDWDAETRQMTNAVCTTYEVVESTDWLEFDAGTTYVVTGAVTVTDSISVNGTVANPTRLILCDGAKLTVSAGVMVGADDFTTNALVICGQTLGSGTLEATGGGNGAGIGGGDHSAGGAVTINGGTVTATGSNGSAGIGGGASGAGGAVTINGGTVTATGGGNGAGVGGGNGGAGGAVTINGGTVTATGGLSGAGIGGGRKGAGGAVTINGGTVTATGGGGAGIGGGIGSTDHGSVAFGVGKWLVKAGSSAQGANPVTVEAYKGDHSAAYVQVRSLLRKEPVPYLDWDAETRQMTNAVCTTYEVVESTDRSYFDAGTTYVVTGAVEVTGRIWVDGTVANPTRLILCDGAKLTVGDGVMVGVSLDGSTTNALVICGQTLGSGTLEATGAGIGSSDHSAGGAVTINGGTVTATGGTNGAGIGGGRKGAGGAVTINGGTVTATGGNDSAGIGGGDGGAGGVVTINGGTVTATGGGLVAGIGGGIGRTDPGSVAFGVGKWQILAGIDAQRAKPVTVEEYVADHSAAYAQIVPFVAEVISADGSVKGFASLQAALGAVDSAGTAFTNTVRLICDVTENVTLGEINKPKAAILDLNGFTLMGKAGNASVIKINLGSALTLTDTSAKQTGTVTMPEGAQDPDLGGGVYNSVGTFMMTGGTITGCKANNGGGVLNGGTFTMSGGTITDCEAQSGGGVYNSVGGTFTMSGGTISDCAAQSGGGVSNNGGTFTMTGGTITNCTAQNGGGVCNANRGVEEATFTLSGGTISDCTATRFGGGVYNISGTFTLSGGTIAGCTATQSGGGVNNSGSFTLSGGAITGCKATQSGGGVFNSSLGTFTLSGGTISDCAAQSGGGVNNSGSFTLSGGAVENKISGAKTGSISGGLFGKEAMGDDKFSTWIASGAETADNPDEATTNEYPTVVRGNANCVVMVRMEGLQSVVVSNGTEAVAGYPAAGYRVFEVVSNATVSLAYVPAEGRELKVDAPTSLTVDEDMVVYPVKPLGPTCDGGTIEKDEDGAWVVTPTNGATKVVITGLPEGETVAGVRIGDYVVPSGAFDGFGEGKTEGEFSLALDEKGEVTIGTETIPVQPTIGELEDGEEPFVVGEGDVTVKVKSIPGLKYTLWRTGALEAPAGESAGGTVQSGGTMWGVVGELVVATDTTVTLVDSEPPEGAAFYRVVVSAW